MAGLVQPARWQVNLTSKPIYGLALPSAVVHRNAVGEWAEELLAINTLKRKVWARDQRRLDIEMKGAFPQPDAHEILGQGYRDATVRNGKVDFYGAADSPELISSDGTGPETWTSAQAEGAIDGVHTDYKLRSPFDTQSKFSLSIRFGAVGESDNDALW